MAKVVSMSAPDSVGVNEAFVVTVGVLGVSAPELWTNIDSFKLEVVLNNSQIYKSDEDVEVGKTKGFDIYIKGISQAGLSQICANATEEWI